MSNQRICDTFSLLWKVLENHGWSHKNGKGLVSWLYIKPGKNVTPLKTEDYFESEDLLLLYIRCDVYNSDFYTSQEALL